MKKAIVVAAVLILAVLAAACVRAGTSEVTPADTDNTPESSLPAAETESHANDALLYTFAHAPQVFADPEAFTGKTYSSMFKVISEKQQYEDGKYVYYATGYKKDSDLSTYTILDFKDRDMPGLAVGDVVYAWGAIEGKGFISDGTNKFDTLWLDVTGIEYDISKADVVVQEKEITLDAGKHKAENGTLSIEVFMLTFSKDGTMLSTKTSDSSVKSMETYYFDIVIHQGGYFTYYSDCNFWIQPGADGFDNIPFPVMDSAKDMKIDLIPFREDGSLIYEPLYIDIKLSE